MRVGLLQPAPGRDAVGLIVETLGEQLGKVVQHMGAEQVGVDGSHAVDAVGADNRQVGHADSSRGFSWIRLTRSTRACSPG